MSLSIWVTFVRKFVAKKFKKSSNRITLNTQKFRRKEFDSLNVYVTVLFAHISFAMFTQGEFWVQWQDWANLRFIGLQIFPQKKPKYLLANFLGYLENISFKKKLLWLVITLWSTFEGNWATFWFHIGFLHWTNRVLRIIWTILHSSVQGFFGCNQGYN